jgi:TRAP transporter TAXI family solute receptor
MTAPAAAQVKRISIGTGGTGGVYFPTGGVIADIINKNLKGIQATAEVTGASVENIRRVDSKQMEMGMSNADVLRNGFDGKKPFTKKMEVLFGFNMHRSTMAMTVLESSGVKSILELKGKRFSIGPPGGNTGVMAERILNAYGLTLNDIKRSPVSFTETVDAMKDGNLDGGAFLGAQPMPSLLDISTTHRVRILPVDGAARDRLIKEQPDITKAQMKAGIVKGHEQSLDTVGVWSAFFFHKDTDPELAFQITKVVWEHRKRLEDTHPANANMAEPGAVIEASIPIHPGAARYFKEIGVLK